MWQVALLFAGLAGCFAKPPRPSGGDAGPDSPVAPACTIPPIVDTFDDVFAPVCGVGFEDGHPDSTIRRGGGVLRQEPGPDIINDASCTWPSFAFDQGAFVQVKQPLRSGGSYTLLQITVAAAQVGIGVISEAEPLLQLFDMAQGADKFVATQPYDATEMAWWRLRPEAGHIAADYSPDGTTWIALGVTTVSAAPASDVDVSLNAGVYNPVADPGIAVFDNFNACP